MTSIPANIKSFVDPVRELLAKESISNIIVKYDGGGDQGGIEDVIIPQLSSIEDKAFHGNTLLAYQFEWDGSKWIPQIRTLYIGDALTEVFSVILDYIIGGFETDEGGYGEFLWNLDDEIW